MAILFTGSISNVKKKSKSFAAIGVRFFATCQALNAKLFSALAAKHLKYNVPPPAG